MQRSKSLRAAVHASVQHAVPFDESNASMGRTRCLKWGTCGDAYISLPTSPYKSRKFVGMVTLCRFPMNFMPNAKPYSFKSNPRIATSLVKNLHLRRFTMNPNLASVRRTYNVSSQHKRQALCLPLTLQSSKKALAASTPDAAIAAFMICWNHPGADKTPIGMRLYRNKPSYVTMPS